MKTEANSDNPREFSPAYEAGSGASSSLLAIIAPASRDYASLFLEGKTMAPRTAIERNHFHRQLRQTAAERYADHQQDIRALMDMIAEELRVHAQQAAGDPLDWGYAGDLGRIRHSLKGLLESQLIGRYNWSETEASRFITDYLEDARS